MSINITVTQKEKEEIKTMNEYEKYIFIAMKVKEEITVEFFEYLILPTLKAACIL